MGKHNLFNTQISCYLDFKSYKMAESSSQSTPQADSMLQTPEKIEVHLQATGDAPIMKQKKYKVDGEKRIDWIIAFIRKFLKLEPTDSLFLYVNQAFAPSPDQTVKNLCECFGHNGKLVLHYARSQAWG